MAMPSRLAISRMVSSSRPLTSRPLISKVTISASDCITSFLVIAFILDSSASVPEHTRPKSSKLLREILDHTVDRIRRRLTKTANRRVNHDLRQVGESIEIPLVIFFNQLHRLRGTHTARRALTARFVLKETHHVARGVGRGILVRQHNDCRRADKTTVFLQRIEVERNVCQRFRQDAARSAAWQIAVELVTVKHATTVILHQLAQGRTGRGEMHARIFHTTRDRVRTQTLAAMDAVGGEPVRSFLHDVPYPMQGLHVVLQRRAPEQTDLSNIGGTQARHATFAFNRLDHRGLFTADVSACAATEVEFRHIRNRRLCLELFQLGGEQRTATVIFVAQINVDFLNANRPRGNQRTFKETMRIALEIVTVLERTRFTLVDVDRHQARTVEVLYDAPFSTGRETRAAQAAQAGVFHDLEY